MIDLPADEVYEYVVTNTNKIADMVEEIRPIHDKLFTPTIDNADENLTKICYDTAHRLYGEQLPEIVEKRLEKELSNIIKHGFGVIYYISHLLVKESNDDGYLVAFQRFSRIFIRCNNVRNYRSKSVTTTLSMSSL